MQNVCRDFQVYLRSISLVPSIDGLLANFIAQCDIIITGFELISVFRWYPDVTTTPSDYRVKYCVGVWVWGGRLLWQHTTRPISASESHTRRQSIGEWMFTSTETTFRTGVKHRIRTGGRAEINCRNMSRDSLLLFLTRRLMVAHRWEFKLRRPRQHQTLP